MTRFKDQINEGIQLIINWFKTSYVQSGVFPCYDIDGVTGKQITNRNLLCELDDYAPFFWYLGEDEYISPQLELLSRMINKGGLLFNRPQIRKNIGLGLPGPTRNLWYADSQDYVEILYGLLELYELSRKPELLKMAKKLFDTLVKYFCRRGEFRSFRLMPLGPTFAVSDAMSGMFIEIALNLSEHASDSNEKARYVSLATEWMHTWLDTDMFKQFGVFPSVHLGYPLNHVPGIKKKGYLAELAKPNASMAYGLLALASPEYNNATARTALETWINGLKRYFLTDTGALTHTPQFHKDAVRGPILSTNFAVLDILCDASNLFDYSKDLAVSIADCFLGYQSEKTGLVPDNIKESRSYIDANTDFAVSLAKVAELTGDDGYLESGRKIITGILNYHRGQYGYFRDVELHTGKPINNLVETRFCSLLLKTLILYRDDIRIYGNQGQWSIFRDR